MGGLVIRLFGCLHQKPYQIKKQACFNILLQQSISTKIIIKGHNFIFIVKRNLYNQPFCLNFFI